MKNIINSSRNTKRSVRRHAVTFLLAIFFPIAAIATDKLEKTESPTITLQQAKNLQAEGYYDRAIEAYTVLQHDDTTRESATYNLAECYLLTGQYEKVPEVLNSWQALAKTSGRWNMLLAESLVNTGQYDNAIELARKAVKLAPKLCRARLLLADTLYLRGEKTQALKEYEWFNRLVTSQLPTDAESLVAAGKGFYTYSVLTKHQYLTDRTRHVLNQMFMAAFVHLDPTYWQARLAAADLLREKYNHDEAKSDYESILLINNNAADAHVGIARIALEKWDFEEVEKRVRFARQTNPNHCGAINTLACCRLVERRYADALNLCEEALAVNPNDLETLAIKASASITVGELEKAQDIIHATGALCPCNSRFHQILAETLGWRRQFELSEKHYKKAIECEPTNSSAFIGMGLMYMQWGYEDKANEALKKAWNLDPFNAQTDYTLDVLKRLATFETIETEHFLIHIDSEHAKILGPYFTEHLEKIYHPICSRYEAELNQKTIIEVFAEHTDFAVRVTAEPWLHTVGACTGRVIAMDSPHQDAGFGGPYNFAQVLTHEFTHTVTLAATNNRISHWFTEGLAVSEEKTDRSYFWKELLADVTRRDELFTLDNIDWGFMRPQKATDRTQAYAQSQWMCEYLVQTYGADVLVKMLHGYRDGKPQDTIFREITGKSARQFDKDFANWAKKEVTRWGFDITPPESVLKMRTLATVKPNDSQVLARLALAELEEANWEKSLKAAKKSVKLDEQNEFALEILVRALGKSMFHAEDNATRKIHEEQLAKRAEQLYSVAPKNRHALQALAIIKIAGEENDKAIPYLQKLKEVWPMDPFAASQLAGIFYERKRFDEALPMFMEIASVNEHDHQIPFRIGTIYKQKGDLKNAMKWFTNSLHLAPFDEKTHEELARIMLQQKKTESAIREYRILCEINPKEARYFNDCALAYNKLGDQENARKYASKAVAIDKNSSAGVLLE